MGTMQSTREPVGSTPPTIAAIDEANDDSKPVEPMKPARSHAVANVTKMVSEHPSISTQNAQLVNDAKVNTTLNTVRIASERSQCKARTVSVHLEKKPQEAQLFVNEMKVWKLSCLS
nr:uncharacterized protein LOC115265079 [Aedes albopictus]